MERTVSKKRNHWRDEAFSERHRLWGRDCPAQDLDGIASACGLQDGWVEYDDYRPVALLELKKWPAQIRMNSAQVRVLRNLADMAGLPAYAVQFWYSEDKETWHFRATSLNSLAVKDFGPDVQVGGERTFVHWLYSLRGREAPRELLRKFRNVQPPPCLWYVCCYRSTRPAQVRKGAGDRLLAQPLSVSHRVKIIRAGLLTSLLSRPDLCRLGVLFYAYYA